MAAGNFPQESGSGLGTLAFRTRSGDTVDGVNP